MPKPIHEMSSWNATAQPPREPDEDYWPATRQIPGAATQFVRDKEDYLENLSRDIGRKVGPDQYELFVSCDPAEAMQLQVEHLHPEFIAVHDIGTTSSRRLLAGLAAASGRATQKLVIRRQGYGMALASLDFVELPTTQGPPLRLYTTEVDADTHQRHALAHILLGHSRLGVVMVGDLPAHALAAAMQPLRDAMQKGPWPGRNLLMLPLSLSGALTGQVAQLGSTIGVTVRTTPPVTRPAEAWAFIAGTWARLREQLGSLGTTLPEIASAQAAPAAQPQSTTAFAQSTPAPLEMRAMPAVPQRSTPAATQPMGAREALLLRYTRRCLEIKGMQSVCVFDVAAQKPLAHAGARPGPASLASQGAALQAAMSAAGGVLGLSSGTVDAAMTLDTHHLLLRAVPGHAGLLLHAVLDKATSNLTLARLQLGRLDAVLEEPSP